MSDTVLDVRGLGSLASLKPRLVSLFGRESAAATFEITGERHGVRLEPPAHAPRPYPLVRPVTQPDAAPKRPPAPLIPASLVEPAKPIKSGAVTTDATSVGDQNLHSADIRRRAMGLARDLMPPAIKASFGIALLGAAGALALTALRNLPAADPKDSAPPVSAWLEINKPVRIYNLEAPVFAGAPMSYTARRPAVGGGREDVLALGTLDGEKPAIRLRIFRRTGEPASAVPLFAAIVHEAAEVGLAVGRSSLPDMLATRFGRFEVADITLARKDEAETPCAGFRLTLEQPALSISGLACGRRTAPMTRQAIGCLVERLDVASARDDRDLIDFFAASELRRNAACAGMRLGPDGLHAPWLDEKPAAVKSTEMKPARAVARDDKPATIRKRLRHR